MRTVAASNEPLCETSETAERLISRKEIPPLTLYVGRRILEVFGYQRIPQICFRLKMSARDVTAVVNGDRLPTVEMLLCIRRITGASFDWILTGEGAKYVAPPHITEIHEDLPPAILTSRRERRPKAPVSYLQ